MIIFCTINGVTAIWQAVLPFQINSMQIRERSAIHSGYAARRIDSHWAGHGSCRLLDRFALGILPRIISSADKRAVYRGSICSRSNLLLPAPALPDTMMHILRPDTLYIVTFSGLNSTGRFANDPRPRHKLPGNSSPTLFWVVRLSSAVPEFPHALHVLHA